MPRYDKFGHELTFKGKQKISASDRKALSLGYKVGDWASIYDCNKCKHAGRIGRYYQKETSTEFHWDKVDAEAAYTAAQFGGLI